MVAIAERAAGTVRIDPPAQTRRRAAPLAEVSIVGRAAMLVLALIVLAAVIGPWIDPRDPLAQDVLSRLQAPSRAHPMGTDTYGRDILARILTGARWSLAGAAIVSLGTTVLGILLGALSALGNRVLDAVIGRLVEALLALPGIVPALALTAVLGPSFVDLLFALIVTSWPAPARFYRSLILRERAAGYVEGAAALGASPTRVLLRHILPNVVGPVAVLATSSFGGVILGLSSLSFLGLGMQPPTPEWGRMVTEGRPYFQTMPEQMILPGLCIAVTVLAVNLSGDALRDMVVGGSSRHGRRR